MIKLPNNNPPMDMIPKESMPMDNKSMMDNEPMGDNINPMNDTDEAVDDPKKNIQRLTGELSQALRTYNDEQETPDTDLNKYVVGMIASQAGKNMTSDEKNEIVKKIQKGEDVESMDNNDDMAMTESQNIVNELNNMVTNDENNKERYEKKSPQRKNPFISNR